MIKNRMIPLAIVAALLVTLSLVGFPWRPSPTLANFNGQAVFTPDECSLDLTGSFNLYNCAQPPRSIMMKVIVDGRCYEMDVVARDRSFSRLLKMDKHQPREVEARLEVDGRVVATGVISLPGDGKPGIHIIRFSSLT